MNIQEDNRRVLREYDEIVDKLATKKLHIHVPIFFYYKEKDNTPAFYRKPEKCIYVNTYYSYGSVMTMLFIHEISHYITHIYDLTMKHDLEFSIIQNVISKFILGHDKHFLGAYDIHEDSHYDTLNLNFKKYDDLINNFVFGSVLELVDYAVTQASLLRK